MLRNLRIFNPGDPINQRKRLPEMANIDGCAPRKIWKGNLMDTANKNDEWVEQK